MAGFFGTSWDLSNSFNSPSVGNNIIGGNLSTEITPRPGSEGPTDTASMLNLWGAPTGYTGQSQQQGGMFNPYQATSGGFYNPYQFGQVQYGPQYGGGQMPWWMNYNVNNPFMPTQPTPSVQPQPQLQTPSRPQGTGPDGKDLTYDETIKYFGLYDDAESALAAGDSQAAYRKDHMQWRSGTGPYSGQGPGQGQYPGRPELGIAGDEQRMADLMGFPSAMVDKFKGLFSGFQDNGALDAEPAIGGGSGFTQIPDMFRTGNTNPFNVPYGPQPMSMQNYLDDSQYIPSMSMQDYLNDSQLFNRYDVSNLEQAQAAGLTDTSKAEVLSPRDYYSRFPQTSSNFNYGFNRAENLFNVPAYSSGMTMPIGDNLVGNEIPGRPGELSAFSENDAGMVDARRNFLFNNNLDLGRPGDTSYVPFEPTFTPDPVYGVSNARELVESNLFGVPKPTPAEDFYAQRRFDAMRQERELQAVMAESKRAAEEYEAQQAAERARIEAEKKSAAEAKAKADAAAAEKARQAAAAQKRMNDNYETGYVAPNIFTSSGPSRRGSRGSRRR